MQRLPSDLPSFKGFHFWCYYYSWCNTEVYFKDSCIRFQFCFEVVLPISLNHHSLCLHPADELYCFPENYESLWGLWSQIHGCQSTQKIPATISEPDGNTLGTASRVTHNRNKYFPKAQNEWWKYIQTKWKMKARLKVESLGPLYRVYTALYLSTAVAMFITQFSPILKSSRCSPALHSTALHSYSSETTR